MLKISLLSGWLLSATLFAGAQRAITIEHTNYTNLYDTSQCSEIQGFYVQTAAHAAITTNSKDPKYVARTGAFAKFTNDPKTPKACKLNYASSYSTFNKDFKGDLQHRVDQGHVNPYGAFNYNETAALETNYFTNVCPQISHFNESQWRFVEAYVLKVSAQFGDVKVFTGVLVSNSHPKKVGSLFMPDFYWKLIEYTKDGNAVQECWLGPNKPTNTSTKPADIADTVAHLKKVILQYYPQFKFDF
jgi:DNA/RNA endonuclease G (NUC1)